jgi:GT2 family glycosyltransferase
MSALPGLGCVVIGRNEGERLRRCLESLIGRAGHIVYVDSGSSDGSRDLARGLGVEVVELDLSVPFTAARARNAGFDRLLAMAPELALVQFVDGDCEVVTGWLERAHARLQERPDLGVVCGRRRERFPERSPYNRLCDVEWDTPIGDAAACGGDAMMRAQALRAVGGFRPDLIAGEEPELCVRLRLAAWRIERLDAEMTLHDADIKHFSQWWKRAVRAGHAFAEGAFLHGAPPTRHWVRECRRAWFWGAAVPAIAFGGAVPTLGASLLLLGAYPVSALRVYRYTRRRGRSAADARVSSVLLTLGKFAELRGMLQFHANRLRGKRSGIIEYKQPDPQHRG